MHTFAKEPAIAPTAAQAATRNASGGSRSVLPPAGENEAGEDEDRRAGHENAGAPCERPVHETEPVLAGRNGDGHQGGRSAGGNARAAEPRSHPASHEL